jgi:integrase
MAKTKRPQDKLTPDDVANAKAGWLGDGGGLWLRTDADGSRKRWIFRHTMHGRTTEIGLGGVEGPRKVSLSAARKKRDQILYQLANGLDPKQEKRKAASKAQSRKTFGETAALVIAARQSGWRTSHEGRNASLTDWTVSLTTACKPIGAKFVDEIDVNDVKRVVAPFWDAEKHTTARRLLNRIELVIEYALAHGWRTADNPATWKRFQHIAPSVPNGGGKPHHPAVGWRDMPALMAKLRKVESTTALALEFAILTGTRSGEARGAKWSEIDWDSAVWTVPHERMKRGVEFDVPLSRQAVDLLRQMQAVRPKTNACKASDEFTFPGANPGRPLNNESLYYLTGRLTDGAATTHGFRASFKTWCGDNGIDRELAEHCLAHAIGNATEQAYNRTTILERRRPIMQMWADHLDGEADTAKVVPFKRA